MKLISYTNFKSYYDDKAFHDLYWWDKIHYMFVKHVLKRNPYRTRIRSSIVYLKWYVTLQKIIIACDSMKHRIVRIYGRRKMFF